MCWPSTVGAVNALRALRRKMPRSAMQKHRSSKTIQGRVTWLLWLALLLPLAQVASTWHQLSHLAPAAAALDEGLPSPHTAHCELCFAASAVDAGAWWTPPLSMAGSAAQYARPLILAALATTATLLLAYRSRAPPLVLR